MALKMRREQQGGAADDLSLDWHKSPRRILTVVFAVFAFCAFISWVVWAGDCHQQIKAELGSMAHPPGELRLGGGFAAAFLMWSFVAAVAVNEYLLDRQRAPGSGRRRYSTVEEHAVPRPAPARASPINENVAL